METRWVAVGFGGPEVLRQIAVDVPAPGPGEVTVAVRAAGMNPADYKHFGPGQDPALLPLTIGYEAAGVLSAVGPGTEIASGGSRVGDEVVAFQIVGGYASAITVDAADVFAQAGQRQLRRGRQLAPCRHYSRRDARRDRRLGP